RAPSPRAAAAPGAPAPRPAPRRRARGRARRPRRRTALRRGLANAGVRSSEGAGAGRPQRPERGSLTAGAAGPPGRSTVPDKRREIVTVTQRAANIGPPSAGHKVQRPPLRAFQRISSCPETGRRPPRGRRTTDDGPGGSTSRPSYPTRKPANPEPASPKHSGPAVAV